MIFFLLLIGIFCCSCSGQYVTEIDECIKNAVTIQPEYNITQNDVRNGTCGFLMQTNKYIVIQPVLVNISQTTRLRLYLLTGNASAPNKVKITEYYNRFLFQDLVFTGVGNLNIALVVLSKNASISVGNFQFFYRKFCQIELIAEDFPKFISPNFFPKKPMLTALLNNANQSYMNCTYRVSSRTNKPFSVNFDTVTKINNFDIYVNNTYVYGPVKVAVPENQKLEFTFRSYGYIMNGFGFNGRVEMSYQSISLLPIDGNPMRGIPVLSYLGENYTIQFGSLSHYDGHVLCQTLGYGSVKSLRPYKNETGTKLIYPSFNCYGSEKLLSQCGELDGKKLHYKKYYYSSPNVTNVTCSDNFNLRLVGGDNSSGIVQLNVGGTWSHICADNMDSSVADAICLELGFQRATNYQSSYGNSSSSTYYNYPDGEYYRLRYDNIMNNVRCNSNTKLRNCKYNLYRSYYDYIMNGYIYYPSDVYNSWSGTNSFYTNPFNNNNNYYYYYYYYYNYYCNSGVVQVQCNSNSKYFLSPGHFQGYLMYNNNFMVCSNDNAKNNMAVYCRYLGYPGVRTSYSNSQNSSSSYPKINLKCNGTEQSPADCFVDTYGYCPEAAPVGVVCQDVSLVGGQLTNEGRVEVYYKGKKGLLCDDNFSINAGNVICRQLGYEYALNAMSNAGYLYGYGNGNFLLDYVYCYGNENSIDDCPNKYWETKSCYGNDVAGLICAGNVSSCGQVSTVEYNYKSSNGYNTTFGANPWQVRLFPNTVNEWCSATIIDRNWLLTSANCFTMSYNNFNVAVMSSKYNWDSANWASTNSIQSVFVHPQYSAVTGDYNLALVKVNAIGFNGNISRICLPEGNLTLEGLNCITTGWNHGLNTYSRPLLGKSILIRNSSYCKSQVQFDDTRMARYLCSDNNMDSYAVFNGESGGPLTCSINGKNVLVGVVARSVSGARATSIRLYSRVDYWLSWIQTTMKNN